MGVNETGGTVLYVDDDESDRFFMQVAFVNAKMGESLRAVGNGREALDYLTGSGAYANRVLHPLPAVVLLDLNLPLVSGFQVLKWIRSRPEFNALPVVMFSSSLRPEDQAMAAELGANEYMEKPLSALKFADVVKRVRDEFLTRTGMHPNKDQDPPGTEFHRRSGNHKRVGCKWGRSMVGIRKSAGTSAHAKNRRMPSQ